MSAVDPPGGLIPNRFEHLLRRDLEPTPLILPVESDLQALDRLRQMARLQGGGLISFLLGVSGSDKTTAAYAAPAHVPDSFAAVLSVPHDIPLREIFGWIGSQLPPPGDKTIPILIDSREILMIPLACGSSR